MLCPFVFVIIMMATPRNTISPQIKTYECVHSVYYYSLKKHDTEGDDRTLISSKPNNCVSCKALIKVLSFGRCK